MNQTRPSPNVSQHAQPTQAVPLPRVTEPTFSPYVPSGLYPGRAIRRRPARPALWWVLGGAAALGIVLFALVIGLIVLAYVAQPRLAAGARVGGVEVGGLTTEAAAEQLNEAFAQQSIRLTDGERGWDVTLSALGVSMDAQATLAAAQEAGDGAQIAPVYAVDLAAAQAGLMALTAQIDIEPVDGNPPTDGRMMDIPFVLDRLRQDLNGEIGDGVLDLSMIDLQGQFDDAAPYTGEALSHTVQAGEELGLIAKQYGVSVADIVALNALDNPDLLYVGQTISIPAAGAFVPTTADAPAPPTNTGRAIVISVDNQRIYAFEDGELVHSHLVSTGLPATPTVKGDYKVYVKLVADDMRGPDYFLPQVPYTMYFYQGYAIHGTYWHNKFGRPMSHGCVNLPTDQAEWFFNWATVGTPVRVV